jgi:UDP-2,3-diacylglucosamine pyrophosphatase LpxH
VIPGPGQPLPWALQGALCLLLALALERVWRTRRGTPVHRRHLLVFLLLALGAGADGLGRSQPGGWGRWAAAVCGTTLGLVLASLPWLGGRRLEAMGWQRGTARRPDPRRPLILVADPHWDGELTGLAEAQAAHPDADWLFLGDVFDVWVGVPGMDGPLQRTFLDWAGQRRRQGRWVGLWLGNREYFLEGLADRFDLMGEGVGGRLADEGLAWEHGDLVNSADWRYRLWNLASRSGPVWLFARMLPKATATALAERLQRALHTTNRAYKLAFPRAAFRAAAAEHPGETFITGHFHTHEVEANGIALPWAHDGAFAVWRAGSVGLLGAPGPERGTEAGTEADSGPAAPSSARIQ